MKTRMTIIALSLPVLFFVFFVICSTIAPYETAVLAQEQKERTTTVADNRYGKGGTLESTSDEKLRILKEIWKDKDGKMRETHYFGYDDKGNPSGETWNFSKNGTFEGADEYRAQPHFTYTHKGATVQVAWNGGWDLRGPNQQSIYDARKDEIDKAMEEVEKQFAKDGTIPKIAKTTAKPEEKPKQEPAKDTQVEQPALTRHEVFSKSGIDACLVGTWRSESVVDTLGGRRGGSGIVMTIKADGVITIDYNQMQSLEAEKAGGIGENNWWKGTASGHITANNRSTSIISVDTSELTHKVTVQGKTTTNALTKLGPALPTGYTCEQANLTWSSAGNTFTFKREEKGPK